MKMRHCHCSFGQAQTDIPGYVFTALAEWTIPLLHGGLYCVGGMDPMLSSSDLAEMAHVSPTQSWHHV